MYANGDGCPKDPAKAFECFLQAAEQGNIDGQYNAAVAYETGDGTVADVEKAKYWYGEAAKQGDKDAKRRLKALNKQS